MRRPLVRPAVPAGFAARSPAWVWLACCAGSEPAELLDPRDREDLVAGLVDRGWTDRQIAEHTRMSTYTTARIRERIGLPANQPSSRQTLGPETTRRTA